MNNNKKLSIFSWAAMGFFLIFTTSLSHGYTNEKDVYAINSLHVALGSPLLPGWIPYGGDPCVERWQGVQCVGSNIISIILNGANLGGQLGDRLEYFSSIITIELSNNNIGGRIPETLPITMQRFFLSGNRFTGSIPSSLSELSLLSNMSLNDNYLTGELPDAFQSLTDLINLDLSSNYLSGRLPPSMQSLSSLTTLHLQNNQLSGNLDVLEDLPLKDLNIRNNLFSGPVPVKLLSIPNFKWDGNPFDTRIAPSPMPLPPKSPFSPAPVPRAVHADPSAGPFSPAPVPRHSSAGPVAQSSGPPGGKTSSSTMRIIAYVVVVMILVIIVVLVFMFCISLCQEKGVLGRLKGVLGRLKEKGVLGKLRSNETMPKNEVKIGIPKRAVKEQKKESEIDIAMEVPKESSRRKQHACDMRGAGGVVVPPVEIVILNQKVIVNPVVAPRRIM